MRDPATLPRDGFARLLSVMEALRDPQDGCPWDRDQSLASLRTYLVEESHELLQAIDDLGDSSRALPARLPWPDADPKAVAALREELGDVLLQVVFQSQITKEAGWFDASDVALGIADKMVRRHPHVFASAARSELANPVDQWSDSPPVTAANQPDRWEQQKRREGKGALDGVPGNLPALLRGQRIGDKAARIGFDWPDLAGVWAKVDEERAELQAAIDQGDPTRIADELGDLLFALTSLARHLHVDAEMSLRGTLDRFTKRFKYVEDRVQAKYGHAHKADLDELEALWQEAKALERAQT